MASRKRKSKGPKSHSFGNKLLLNQWLISLFGIDPLVEYREGNRRVLPFHKLSEPIRGVQFEGLDPDNLHKFYHELIRSDFFWDERSRISKDQLLEYEQNIGSHTRALNGNRDRPITWKYFQWLSLLFTEVYLDRFFSDPDGLLDDLNAFVARFNARWPEMADVEPFQLDDLNKICLQNATGSGKTLLMHTNVRQFEHYARRHGRDNDITRTILITPNERLSEQHVREMAESGLQGSLYLAERGGLFGAAKGLERVDVFEVTKLQDKEGPNTVATRSLGDKNLLLVDEGHRGLSGTNATDESTWFRHRNHLSEKGFTFEYSATFQQAVSGTGHEDAYAKTVLFDYSYRWFYEDGFGKDYKIDNLPDPDSATLQRLVDKGNLDKATRLANEKQVAEAMMPVYLTAALLKFYQQLRIYEENRKACAEFNLEKPLWVFVGSTVSKASGTKDEKAAASDVAKVILFFARFLADPKQAKRHMDNLLRGNGASTGLMDQHGNDIFAGAFHYLAEGGWDVEELYTDILTRFFQSPHGGRLVLDRVKGDSGEVALKSGASETTFGLINVGDAKGLCDHISEHGEGLLKVEDSDFSESQFETVRESSSPVNLLVGSKKFVEGWDCWRVSCMGLMHVGKSEGAQIIQLFGRGVRLKGYEWSLKRSGHSHAPECPPVLTELETLNVFGIEADFMERFKKFLAEEGLPGNEKREVLRIPLNVTYDVGKKLKILRPKRKRDGKEYNFKKDGPVPEVGVIPDYLYKNPVVSDWYARIHRFQSIGTNAEGAKAEHVLRPEHVALLDWDQVFFELERFKRERSWYNINMTKAGLRALILEPGWYVLRMPGDQLQPVDFQGVRSIQRIVCELIKRYCEKFYQYESRAYIEPRLELRELTLEDENFPRDEDGNLLSEYQLTVDGDETTLISGIRALAKEVEERKTELRPVQNLAALQFGTHLFQPLLHVGKGTKIDVKPVSLTESEFQFVTDLKNWFQANEVKLKESGTEMFLLRNLSVGKGVGFFEAQNFYPDFILWVLQGDKQYVTFLEPHGLLHGSGLGDEKVQFHKRIKDIEKRLGDPDVILNSFILSWTKFRQLKWGESQEEFENNHVLFMAEDRDHYVGKLFKDMAFAVV